jgi:hypothetical protein
MNAFIERDPKELYKIRFLDIYMSGHKGFIAGGCFKNIFQNVKIKDVDIFFLTELDFTEAKMYYDKNEGYTFSYENSNTVAFKNKKTNIRIELIRNTYGSPEEILSKFDFSIVKFAYCKRTIINDDQSTSIEYYCTLHDRFFEHLTCKKLVLEVQILFPVSTFERSFRYCRYGFGLCRESKANLLEAIKTADTSNLSNELYFGID